MSAIGRLAEYATPYKSVIRKASFYSVINKLFDIAPEILIGIAVDIVVNKEQSFLADLGFVDVFTQLWVIGILTLIIWACESIFEYLYNIQWRGLAQALQHDLRRDTFANLQQLDLSFFEDQPTGNIVSILGDDVNQLERFLDGGANNIIQVITTVIAVGAVFFYISPLVATFSFLPIPVILVGAFIFQKRLAPKYLKVRNAAGRLNSFVTTNVTGIACVKSYTAEAWESDLLQANSQKYKDANTAAIKLSSAFIPIIRMAILSGFICTLCIGGYLTLEGEIAVGAYSVLVFLTQRLLWPMTGLAEIADLYQRAMASATRILDLLQNDQKMKDGSESLPSHKVKGALEFRDLEFAYQSRATVLENFNLKIEEGKTIAIVGGTGGGKSTIVKLLLRFYDPTAGEILLDGHNIRNLKLQDLRSSISLVSQDTFLINGSVLDNIRYGSFDATPDQVVEAARIAEADEFISELPSGYKTIVGERGQKLSGGQKQRISIARAILKNTPILIFDEATSSVDNETEAAIQRSIEKVSKGRTTIVIAHRLSTVRNADQICVLDNGVVVQCGKHEELAGKTGLYKQLWDVQTGVGC
jgi:ATP-binding cassette, subfamily B, bacterial